jgi:hypothetical protein
VIIGIAVMTILAALLLGGMTRDRHTLGEAAEIVPCLPRGGPIEPIFGFCFQFRIACLVVVGPATPALRYVFIQA